MDSMSIRGLTAPILEVFKSPVAESEPKSAHVETVASPQDLPQSASQPAAEMREESFIGSIDCGTTSSRFLIFNREGTPVASHQIEFENIYPSSGYVLSCPLGATGLIGFIGGMSTNL
jgi:glycerol kinase